MTNAADSAVEWVRAEPWNNLAFGAAQNKDNAMHVTQGLSWRLDAQFRKNLSLASLCVLGAIVLSATALSQRRTIPTTEELDKYASARQVSKLDALLAPNSPDEGGRSPFRMLGHEGAYGVGGDGWHVVGMRTPSNRVIEVFTTRLTSEDYGELVFEVTNDGLTYHPEDEDQGVKIVHHDFELWFDPPAKAVTITDWVQFHRSGAPREFIVRFSPAYRVRSIVDENGAATSFIQAGGCVALDPAGGADFKLKFQYDAIVNNPGVAGAITANEATLTNDYWYPMIARGPSTYDATIHGPLGWVGVAQGTSRGGTDDETETVIRYSMPLPVTFFSLSCAPYRVHDDAIRGRNYVIRSLHMSDDDMALQCKLYADVIEFYCSTFGELPFDGYGAVVSDVYGSGAMEGYSFATYQDGELPERDAHEPSHSWWGGMIACTYLHSFWNESFADYSEGLFHRECPVGDLPERRQAFIGVPGPNSAWSATSLLQSGATWGSVADTLGYGKGADVLQLLELQLGTKTMEKVLHDWVAAHDRTTPGEWQEFQEFADHATNGKTRLFLDEWLKRKGDAGMNVSNVRWRPNEVTGTLSFDGEPYHFQCEVMLEFPDGSRRFTTFDTCQSRDADGAYVFRIPCDTKPRLVSVDPWRRIPRKWTSADSPTTLNDFLRFGDVLVSPQHASYGKWLRNGSPLNALPPDLDGKVLAAHPDELPGMRALCAKAGFLVNGDVLTYHGTSVDLRHGGAWAVLDLPGGKRCAIALGDVPIRPEIGNARLVVFDELGRFVRGLSDPKTTGWGSFLLDRIPTH